MRSAGRRVCMKLLMRYAEQQSDFHALNTCYDVYWRTRDRMSMLPSACALCLEAAEGSTALPNEEH